MSGVVSGELLIDGSHGEGGGQILRTAISLSAVTGRALRIENIRAGRPRPGLAAQHLTAIRSAASICAAEVRGETLGSSTMHFHPTSVPLEGSYRFDVAEAREGGSAGAATLVLQTVTMPAVFAAGMSRFQILGGTHIASSPTFDYLREVWIPILHRIGIRMEIELKAFGFFPIGRGEIVVRVEGSGPGSAGMLQPINLIERGPLISITGRALAANLPAHIPQRMADRARALLERAAPRIELCIERVRDCTRRGQDCRFIATGLRISTHGRQGRQIRYVGDHQATCAGIEQAFNVGADRGDGLGDDRRADLRTLGRTGERGRQRIDRVVARR